jgi:hypothetical protein
MIKKELLNLNDEYVALFHFPFPDEKNEKMSYTITPKLKLARNFRHQFTISLTAWKNINQWAVSIADRAKLYRVYISGAIVECNATDDYETQIEDSLTKFDFKTRRYRFPFNDIKSMTNYTITHSLKSAHNLRSLIDRD